MTLWDWASRAYARPGAEPALLELQDAHGHCVSYLLWAAWAADQGRSIDAARLAEAVALARDWEAKVTQPLRLVRRDLKAPRPGVAAEAQTLLREKIKAEELAAERLLLDALEQLAPPPAGPPRPLDAALDEAVGAWGPAPAHLVVAISCAFSDG